MFLSGFKISAVISMTQLRQKRWRKSKATKMKNLGRKVQSLGLNLHLHPKDLSFCILLWLIYL